MAIGEREITWAQIRETILQSWADGLTNPEIALRLASTHPNAWGKTVAVSTVYKYAQKIYRDLDVQTQASAVAEAYRRGYLPCPCNEPMRRSDVLRYAQNTPP
jgi:DNA-binding CsgD family transcriptional regulator